MTAKTFAEQLDAAQTGQEFGAVLNELFRTIEDAQDRNSE